MKNLLPLDPVFFSPDYHDLIGLIYDAINNKNGFFPFLQRFVEVFEGHSAAFTVYDTQAEAVVGHWKLNIPDSAMAFYQTHISHQDALIDKAMAVSQNGELRFVASNLDLGDDMPEIREKTRAGEWLESFGAHEAAGAIALNTDNYLNFFSIQRARHQPEFTREQLAVFDLFLPHLNRAVSLYTRMSSLASVKTPASVALDTLQWGILIYDASFRVVFRNGAADAVIAANSDLNLSEDGLLSFRDKAFSEQFVKGISSAVHASTEDSDWTDTILYYRKGSQAMTLTIAPLNTLTGSENERGGAVLTLHDWSSRAFIEPEILKHNFGLTEAEARVSYLLTQGESLAGIAETICRSRETVKSHLKSIYGKTNTNRQGELVALLFSSASLH